MSTTQLRMGLTGLFFLMIFFLGFWLSRSGKPYGLLVFTLHKLIALGAVVYLVTAVYAAHPVSLLSPIQIFAIAITVLCFLITIITGGLLSIDKTMPAIVLKLHQITPFLTVVSSAVTVYFNLT